MKLLKKNIDLIVYDFDGVMTDNRALVFEDGKEAVFVNRSDGLAIGIIKRLGIPQIILSTEKNQVVSHRAKKLNIPVIQGVEDKKIVLLKYLVENNMDINKVVYIGNDINDEEIMNLVGLPVAPYDAHDRIKKLAKIILKTRGGYGVVREFIEYIN